MTRIEVTLPQWGEGVEGATLVTWLRGVGDLVALGEELAEIEVEKAQGAVEAPAAGRLVEILVEPETTVPVGTVLAMIETDH